MQTWLAPKYLMWLWQGFGVTVGLSLTVALAATAFGFVLAIARHARYGWLRRGGGPVILSDINHDHEEAILRKGEGLRFTLETLWLRR